MAERQRSELRLLVVTQIRVVKKKSKEIRVLDVRLEAHKLWKMNIHENDGGEGTWELQNHVGNVGHRAESRSK